MAISRLWIRLFREDLALKRPFGTIQIAYVGNIVPMTLYSNEFCRKFRTDLKNKKAGLVVRLKKRAITCFY